MIINLDNYTDEELLIHYGIKGMKWGRRQSKSVTGISRTRGALIDRNDRMTARIKNARKGKGLLRDRVSLAIDRAVLGREFSKKNMDVQLSLMKTQNARLKSGRITVRDRLAVALTVSPLDLVVSNRPK